MSRRTASLLLVILVSAEQKSVGQCDNTQSGKAKEHHEEKAWRGIRKIQALCRFEIEAKYLVKDDLEQRILALPGDDPPIEESPTEGPGNVLNRMRGNLN